jgi:hypothetical protein
MMPCNKFSKKEDDKIGERMRTLLVEPLQLLDTTPKGLPVVLVVVKKQQILETMLNAEQELPVKTNRISKT